MSSAEWDAEAATFDHEPDHGLADAQTRAAWRDLLLSALPAPPARVADIGCGTGTLTRLLVDEGFSVDGLDFSPGMIARARAKVPESRFVVGDAADPSLPTGAYDVVLCRHVLWAMPDPSEAFARWIGLLKPGGRAVLVEGNWHTGAGLTAAQAVDIVRSIRQHADIRNLRESTLWGKDIDDERFMVVTTH